MACDLVVGQQARGQDEAQLVLFEKVADAIPDAGLRSGVGNLLEPEGGHVIMRRLFSVSDVELDVIPIDLRERIAPGLGRGAHESRSWRRRGGGPVKAAVHEDVAGRDRLGAQRFHRPDRLCRPLPAGSAAADRFAPRVRRRARRAFRLDARPVYHPGYAACIAARSYGRAAFGHRRCRNGSEYVAG